MSRPGAKLIVSALLLLAVAAALWFWWQSRPGEITRLTPEEMRAVRGVR